MDGLDPHYSRVSIDMETASHTRPDGRILAHGGGWPTTARPVSGALAYCSALKWGRRVPLEA